MDNDIDQINLLQKYLILTNDLVSTETLISVFKTIPLLSTASYAERLEVQEIVSSLIQSWRQWLEDTYASDIPERLYSELFDSSMDEGFRDYEAVEKIYAEKAIFALQVIEFAKQNEEMSAPRISIVQARISRV